MSNLKPAGRARRSPPSDGIDSDLAASVMRHGQLQPIVALPDGEVIIGERRRRVLEAAGVPPEVRMVDVDEAEALAIRLSEEFSKSDMGVIDRAEGVRELIGLLRSRGEKITYPRLGELIGTSKDTIQDLVSIGELPSEVKEIVAHNNLGLRAARTLAAVPIARDNRNTDRVRISVRQLKTVATKIASGKAHIKPVSRRGRPSPSVDSAAVVEFIQQTAEGATDAEGRSTAAPKARKAFLDNPSITLEEGQHAAKREREEGRRKEERERNAIDTAGQFFAEFTTKIRGWVTGLQGVVEHASFCPANRREDLTVWLTQLARASNRLIDILDGPEPEEELTPKRAQVLRGLLEEGTQ